MCLGLQGVHYFSGYGLARFLQAQGGDASGTGGNLILPQ